MKNLEKPEGELSFTRDWFSPNKRFFKNHLLPLSNEPLKALEIGAFEGRCSRWLLKNVLRHSDSHLTCIDPFDYSRGSLETGQTNRVVEMNDMAKVRERFITNTKSYCREGKCQHIELPSQVALLQFPLGKSFDFIYIDGDHYASHALLDIVYCWRLLKPGAIMAIDDYQWRSDTRKNKRHLARPKIAIDAFLKIFEEQYRLLVKQSQVWIKRTAQNAMLCDGT